MDHMTVGQAAAELGMSPRGVRERIERGEMQAELVTPRLLLIPRAEVERWKALGRPKRGPKGKAHYLTAARILERARELISDPKAWIRDYDGYLEAGTGRIWQQHSDAARDAHGTPVPAVDDAAVCWNDTGAITRAYRETQEADPRILETVMHAYVDDVRIKERLDPLSPEAAHRRTVEMLDQAAAACLARAGSD